MRSDHYQALGVGPQASQAEIRAAYLRLMRASHPDSAPHDPTAAERARRANAAWEVLGDATKRAAYDRLRSGGRVAGPGVRVARRAEAPAPAYSQAKRDFAVAFHRASVRLAVALLAASVVLTVAIAL